MAQSPNATAQAMAAVAEAMLLGPGLKPPPGVIPNSIDPSSQAHWVYVVLPICLAVSTPFVLIRLYTVFFILKSHGWADYTSAAAWAFLVGYIISAYFVVQYGGGVHQWDVQLGRVIEFAKLANTTEMLYSPAIFLAKLSILLMYRRLFDTAGTGKTHYLIHILIWANFAFYFPYLGATVFQCVPRARIWDPTIKGGCINLLAAFIAASAINVVSDFSILLLPLYRISKLKIPTRRKLGVLAIFAVGLFTCITSIMRLVVSFRTGSPDKTFNLQPPALWSAAEIASAVLAGCMPATAAFFNHVAPKVKRGRKGGRNGGRKWRWSGYRVRVEGVSPEDKDNNNKDGIEKDGMGVGVGANGGVGAGAGAGAGRRTPQAQARHWNESYLLRSGWSEAGDAGHVGVAMDVGDARVAGGAGDAEGGMMRQQVSHSSDEEAREKVEEHLVWSGWRR